MSILLYTNYSKKKPKTFLVSVGYGGTSSEEAQFSGEGGNGDIPNSREAPREEGWALFLALPLIYLGSDSLGNPVHYLVFFNKLFPIWTLKKSPNSTTSTQILT